MNRQQKIELLRKISEGRASLEIFKEKKMCCTFGYVNNRYWIDDKEVSQSRYMMAVEAKNRTGANRSLTFSYGAEEAV